MFGSEHARRSLVTILFSWQPRLYSFSLCLRARPDRLPPLLPFEPVLGTLPHSLVVPSRSRVIFSRLRWLLQATVAASLSSSPRQAACVASLATSANRTALVVHPMMPTEARQFLAPSFSDSRLAPFAQEAQGEEGKARCHPFARGNQRRLCCVAAYVQTRPK